MAPTDSEGRWRTSGEQQSNHALQMTATKAEEETLRWVEHQRKPSWIKRGLAGHENMCRIWKGWGEGDMEKTHKMSALTGSELRITKPTQTLAGAQVLC